MIEVVSGLIIRDGRILLTQRPKDKSDYPFCWETPGGKVDGMHESHHSALTRELREELGIELVGIAQKAIFCDEIATVKNGTVLWLLYSVIIHRSPAPCHKEGQGMGWFLPRELDHLDMPPGNVAWRRRVGRVYP